MQYATDVLSGAKLAGRKVRLACQRFVSDLQKAQAGWEYEYEQVKGNAACTIIEIFPHEKGELQDQLVRLQDWQCFIICNLFSWIEKGTGKRRFSEALVMIPRGNGKSPMGAWVANLLAWFDGELGAEVYCAATTKSQSLEVFRPAKYIIEKLLEQDPELGITVHTESMFQDQAPRGRMLPVIGKPKDGKAPHGVVNDEYHEQPDDRLYDSLKRGMDKRPQSLMFNISTAGDNVEGPCYRMQEQATMLLEGQYEDETFFAVVYDVDADVPWTSRDALIMANPNFGVSIVEKKILASQQEAIRNTAKQNPFRCKNQNHWAQSMDGWINMESWDACKAPIAPEQFLETDCYHGSDLAFKLDICATVKLFAWLGEDGQSRYAAFAKGYLPRRQVDATRPHFQAWEKDGLLTVHDGGEVDFQELIEDTVRDVDAYKIRELCYDPKFAGPQYSQVIAERTGIERVEVKPQDYSEGMIELESAIEGRRIQHDGNPLLRWCIANILAKRNQMTGVYTIPGKARADKKIDLGVALIIAMCRARSVGGTGGEASSWDGNVTWF